MSRAMIRKHPKFPGVYISGPSDKLKLYTKNLTPGYKVYDEKLIDFKREEFREWNPYRSNRF
ncbi:MAG: fibrillarin-like rRNA/tRNA 2'-O-methyltransferase [Promethearchaeota archaeon]